MSLTSLLRSKTPLKIFFDQAFPGTQEVVNSVNKRLSTLEPTDTLHAERFGPHPGWVYGLVGTAFDYRARYYFRISPVKDLVAYMGGTMLGPLFSLRVIYPKGKGWGGLTLDGGNFWGLLSEWLNSCDPTKRRLSDGDEIELDFLCLALAKLEINFRSGGRLSDADIMMLSKAALAQDIEELLKLLAGHFDEAVLVDLKLLSEMFYRRWNKMFGSRVVLNPMFSGSLDVGGADADLLVQGTLFDLKTSKRPIDKKEIYQLLGYAILDLNDKYKIKGLGLYFARHGFTIRWGIQELLNKISFGKINSLAQARGRYKKEFPGPMRGLSTGAYDQSGI